ncbi:MAG TPA: DNA polymerase III subunit delta [Candidatus Marinimicrobia bacterium]|nr:DNA polymerase III subunit delta [Candidatus Neomarinimicrobiota bacterium]
MNAFGTFQKELDSIQQGKLKAVYFIYGDDLYLIDQAVLTAQSAYRRKYPSAEISSVNAMESSASHLQNALYSNSLFESHSLLIIWEIKGLIPTARKVLNQYLQQANPENCLLLVQSAIDRKNKFLKELEKSAKLMQAVSPDINEIPRWLQTQARKRKRAISGEAITELISITGSSLSDLSNEMDKLDLYCEPAERIEAEDVRAVAGAVKSYPVDFLWDALKNKDLKRAIHVLKNLTDHGYADKATQVVIGFYNFFNALLMIKSDPQRKRSDFDLQRAANIFFRPTWWPGGADAGRYSFPLIRAAIAKAVETDTLLKTNSQADPLTLLVQMFQVIGEEDLEGKGARG